MANLTVTIPGPAYSATIEGLCLVGGYTTGDKTEFAKQVLANFVRGAHTQYQVKTETEAAEAAARAQALIDLTGLGVA